MTLRMIPLIVAEHLHDGTAEEVGLGITACTDHFLRHRARYERVAYMDPELADQQRARSIVIAVAGALRGPVGRADAVEILYHEDRSHAYASVKEAGQVAAVMAHGGEPAEVVERAVLLMTYQLQLNFLAMADELDADEIWRVVTRYRAPFRRTRREN